MLNDFQQQQLVALWLSQDVERMALLTSVKSLELPQGMIAAGVIRNMVWDKLHGLSSTPFNDVDVIYFDPNAKAEDDMALEQQLKAQQPTIDWQVRNQARMHLRNGDRPYTSCQDAMSFWPEQETAVGARLNPHGEIEVISGFGLNSLLNGHITANPAREPHVFKQRMEQKRWLARWPKLSIHQ
ncbi:nucleotidyltransferase family protein [Vibrio olivae]|uniref:Nucleotidyltransferase family protein n=1 Tax=Vibrio olivae TaxID=1243002 RepID=A0ABV5HTS7_9VIBR